MKYSPLRRAYFCIVLFTSLAILTGSCSNNDNPEPDENQILVSAEFLYSNTAEQLKLLVQLSGTDIDANEFLYDIDIYKVTYKLADAGGNGAPITASGLIVLPKTNQEVGMLSFHHGTITDFDEAPSNFSAGDLNTISYAAMASVGLIGVIPDYLGFGSSSNIMHPYYIEDLMASSVLDMLKAAAELAKQKGVEFNGKLFLAGYSEGGYATMAAHKAIESQGLEGFSLVASFPGAGAYDLKGMQTYIFGLDEYNDPHYLAYMARAYQVWYGEDNLLNDFFNEPYASRIPGLFNGQKGASEINAQLTGNITDLIQEGVLKHIDTDPQYAYLAEIFTRNSLTDWKPQVKMYMYHGLSDTTVPYQNSVSTLNKLLSNGASPTVVSLTPLDGTHSSAVEPYIAAIIEKILTLK